MTSAKLPDNAVMPRRTGDCFGVKAAPLDGSSKTEFMVRAERLNRFEDERCEFRLAYLRWQEEETRKALSVRIERFRRIEKALVFHSGHSKAGVSCQDRPTGYPNLLLGNRRLQPITGGLTSGLPPKTPPLRFEGHALLGWDTRPNPTADGSRGPLPLIPSHGGLSFEPDRDLFSMSNMSKWRNGRGTMLGRQLKFIRAPEASGEERFLSQVTDGLKRVKFLRARAKGSFRRLREMKCNDHIKDVCKVNQPTVKVIETAVESSCVKESDVKLEHDLICVNTQ